MSDRRTYDGDVFIDCSGENDELIVKYMKNDISIKEDIRPMSNEKRAKLIDDIGFLELPIKKDIIKEIGYSDYNEIMDAWRNRRTLMVNNEYNNNFLELLKKSQLLDTVFNNQNLGDIQYIEPQKSFTLSITLKFYDVIVDCLKNGKINEELIEANIGNGNADELMNEMKMIGIELSDDNVRIIRGCFDPILLRGSTILLDTQYDKFLKEWLGNEYKWKLIYRASEHGYTAESFHEYCDDKGPTLVVIKSSGGWIFGGYTTQSWKSAYGNGGMSYDMI